MNAVQETNKLIKKCLRLVGQAKKKYSSVEEQREAIIKVQIKYAKKVREQKAKIAQAAIKANVDTPAFPVADGFLEKTTQNIEAYRDDLAAQASKKAAAVSNALQLDVGFTAEDEKRIEEELIALGGQDMSDESELEDDMDQELDGMQGQGDIQDDLAELEALEKELAKQEREEEEKAKREKQEQGKDGGNQGQDDDDLDALLDGMDSWLDNPQPGPKPYESLSEEQIKKANAEVDDIVKEMESDIKDSYQKDSDKKFDDASARHDKIMLERIQKDFDELKKDDPTRSSHYAYALSGQVLSGSYYESAEFIANRPDLQGRLKSLYGNALSAMQNKKIAYERIKRELEKIDDKSPLLPKIRDEINLLNKELYQLQDNCNRETKGLYNVPVDEFNNLVDKLDKIGYELEKLGPAVTDINRLIRRIGGAPKGFDVSKWQEELQERKAELAQSHEQIKVLMSEDNISPTYYLKEYLELSGYQDNLSALEAIAKLDPMNLENVQEIYGKWELQDADYLKHEQEMNYKAYQKEQHTKDIDYLFGDLDELGDNLLTDDEAGVFKPAHLTSVAFLKEELKDVEIDIPGGGKFKIDEVENKGFYDFMEENLDKFAAFDKDGVGEFKAEDFVELAYAFQQGDVDLVKDAIVGMFREGGVAPAKLAQLTYYNFNQDAHFGKSSDKKAEQKPAAPTLDKETFKATLMAKWGEGGEKTPNNYRDINTVMRDLYWGFGNVMSALPADSPIEDRVARLHAHLTDAVKGDEANLYRQIFQFEGDNVPSPEDLKNNMGVYVSNMGEAIAAGQELFNVHIADSSPAGQERDHLFAPDEESMKNAASALDAGGDNAMLYFNAIKQQKGMEPYLAAKAESGVPKPPPPPPIVNDNAKPPQVQKVQAVDGGMQYVRFYDNDKANYIFANFWDKGQPLQYELTNSDGSKETLSFKTPEHLFQAMKFKDHPDMFKDVHAQTSPNRARVKAGELFRANPAIRDAYFSTSPKPGEAFKTYDDMKNSDEYKNMLAVVKQRMQNDPEFKETLENTGKAYILEDTYIGPPKADGTRGDPDVKWGGGPDGMGENMLGMIYMEVRNEGLPADQRVDPWAMREKAREERKQLDKALGADNTNGKPLQEIAMMRVNNQLKDEGFKPAGKEGDQPGAMLNPMKPDGGKSTLEGGGKIPENSKEEAEKKRRAQEQRNNARTAARFAQYYQRMNNAAGWKKFPGSEPENEHAASFTAGNPRFNMREDGLWENKETGLLVRLNKDTATPLCDVQKAHYHTERGYKKALATIHSQTIDFLATSKGARGVEIEFAKVASGTALEDQVMEIETIIEQLASKKPPMMGGLGANATVVLDSYIADAKGSKKESEKRREQVREIYNKLAKLQTDHKKAMKEFDAKSKYEHEKELLGTKPALSDASFKSALDAAKDADGNGVDDAKELEIIKKLINDMEKRENELSAAEAEVRADLVAAGNDADLGEKLTSDDMSQDRKELVDGLEKEMKQLVEQSKRLEDHIKNMGDKLPPDQKKELQDKLDKVNGKLNGLANPQNDPENPQNDGKNMLERLREQERLLKEQMENQKSVGLKK